MPAPPPARQAFPRWHVTRDSAAAEPCAPPRTAKIIAFPAGAARGRPVITYPATLVLPDRHADTGPRAPAARRRGAGVMAVLVGMVLALASLALALG